MNNKYRLITEVGMAYKGKENLPKRKTPPSMWAGLTRSGRRRRQLKKKKKMRRAQREQLKHKNGNKRSDAGARTNENQQRKRESLQESTMAGEKRSSSNIECKGGVGTASHHRQRGAARAASNQEIPPGPLPYVHEIGPSEEKEEENEVTNEVGLAVVTFPTTPAGSLQFA